MTGLYGKLPAHGDFVQHNLDPVFVSVWDNWLQKSLLASQEDLQDQWLNLYLIGPIWRFALSANVIDENHCWSGIIAPSVDKVGRYYPLTVATALPPETGLATFMSQAAPWFTEVENVVLEALEVGWTLEEIAYKLGDPGLELDNLDTYAEFTQNKDYQTVIHIDSPENRLIQAMPTFSDFLLSRLGEPTCLWWTTGSDQVPPVLLASSRLPRPTSYTTLLTGHWQTGYWNEFN